MSFEPQDVNRAKLSQIAREAEFGFAGGMQGTAPSESL